MAKENNSGTEFHPLLKDLKRANGRIQVPNKSILLAVCAAGIGGTFQYGYNISIINAPTKSIHNFINQTWSQRYGSNITDQRVTLLWSIIVSVYTVGGLMGASIGGTLAVRFGRKGAMLLNNTFAMLAALLMGLSSATGLYELLVIARLSSGINAGIALCAQPMYLGEIAPRALRGAMAMGTSIFITGGIFTGQVIGLIELLGGEERWPILLSTTCIPAVVQLLVLPWFPESPWYLLIDKGDVDACRKALMQLHGHGNYHAELEDMEKERNLSLGVQPKTPWQLFTDPSLRWQLGTIILLNSAQQLNGINAIYFYATYVFGQAGISVNRIPYVTMGTGVCECISALTSGLLIESLGRKTLIMGGYSLMTVWCICLTLTLAFQEASPWVPYLTMICLFAFILSFGLGPGGVTNILNAELFTQTARPAAGAIGGSVSWLSLFFISMAFPFIVKSLQQYSFLVFLVICCLVAVYILFFVPETKNKTFIEIQKEFHSKHGKQQSDITGTDSALSPLSLLD